tara:strand:+ start:4147 stop:5589 length:1443 start_codon:yes stop_codon:yes gene_type:complete
MLHFYEGQVRKFVTQFIRVLSNFSIEMGKGKNGEVNLRQVPVIYGDMTRQVANIIKNNSENFLQSAPRIAAYISGLEYDRDRMQNPYHIEKQHLKERHYDETTKQYTNKLGAGYTIQKVMPSPFRLNVTADIFSTNTDMKLQILEQILYLFNPDFEIQKTDNYIDWTSLSYIELTGITFSSRTIPVGADTEIDVATMQFSMPIWLSPPVKVSKLGVIQKIIMSIYDDEGTGAMNKGLIDGSLISRSYITPKQYHVLLTGNQLRLLGTTGTNAKTGGDGFHTNVDHGNKLDPFVTYGPPLNWHTILNQYGKITNGVSQIKLQTPEGKEIVGTIATSTLDDSILMFNIDSDTIPANTPALPNVTKIVNPLTFDPGASVANGTRYLLVDNLGDSTTAWGDIEASTNDIIQYNSSTSKWSVVFDASNPDSTQHYITNLHTGIQYKWNGIEWLKSYEGVYVAGKWTMVLDGGSTPYDASTDVNNP